MSAVREWAPWASRAMLAAAACDRAGFLASLAATKDAGASGLVEVMCAWVDSTLQIIGAPIGQPMRMEFHEDTQGTATENVDDLDDPEMVWAFRFINARCARDLESCKTLLGVLPEGKPRLGYLYALAHTCGRTASLAIEDKS